MGKIIPQKGFGLFEIVISLFIFSIVLLGFGEAVTKAYLQTLKLHQQISRFYDDNHK